MSDSTSTGFKKAIGVGGAAALLLMLLVLAFTWPSKTAEPRNIDVGVVAAGQMAAQVSAQLDQAGPFEAALVDSREAVEKLIKERELFGAVVVTDDGVTVLTASAAGAAPAQAINGAADALASAMPDLVIERVDVVPLSVDDPSGAGLGASAFPLAMGGIIGGVLAAFAVAGTGRKIALIAAYAVAGGLGVALILNTWFGYLPGSFIGTWAVVALALCATASLVAGLAAAIGRPGVAMGAILTMLVANPISGATLPWQFLAEPWGQLGQFLVPGASATLLRTVAYFPDADQGAQWLTLALWACVGLILVVLGGRKAARN